MGPSRELRILVDEQPLFNLHRDLKRTPLPRSAPPTSGSSAASQDLHPLIRKLDRIIELSAAERDAVVNMPMTVRDLKSNHDIVRFQDRPSQCCLILEGFAYRYKTLESGSRQIFSLHVSGDIPDLQSIHLAVMDHSLASLVPSKVAFITHETVRALVRAHPRIGDALWRDTLIDAAIFREWMMAIGRRDAYARIAHIFCELFVRRRAMGLADGFSCEMPMTQTELGDALGLSTVHVTRVLLAKRPATSRGLKPPAR